MPRQTRLNFRKRKRSSFTSARKRRRSTKPGTRNRVRFRQFNPSCRFMKLRYCDTITLDAGAGTLASHKFRANSLFDPDFTGTGHQPMGFDQMALLYNHYAVLGSKITCNFTASGTSATTAQSHVGVRLDDSTTAPTVANTERERSRGSTRLLRGVWGGKGTTISKNFSAYKFFCRKDRDLPENLTANVAANPSEIAFFNVWQSGIDATANADLVYVDVQIDYLVKFFEPKPVDAS